jgi:hypothetical protein
MVKDVQCALKVNTFKKENRDMLMYKIERKGKEIFSYDVGYLDEQMREAEISSSSRFLLISRKL